MTRKELAPVLGLALIGFAALGCAQQPAAAANQAVSGGTASQARELLPRIDYEPWWSPDGSSITFISNRNGPMNVYTIRADGSELRRVTDHAGPDDMPAFSPDGKSIAFVSEITGDPEVYVVRLDGSKPQRITTSAGPDIHPTWSRDGNSLLLNSGPAADESRIDLCMVRLDDLRRECLTSSGINTYGSFSADGKRVLYRRSTGEDRSQIRVLDLETHKDTAVTKGEAFDGWPSWSPDATRIAFASDRSGTFEIYVMSADGTNLRRLGGTGERSTNPRWSPDGRQILFTARRGRTIGMFLFDVAGEAANTKK